VRFGRKRGDDEGFDDGSFDDGSFDGATDEFGDELGEERGRGRAEAPPAGPRDADEVDLDELGPHIDLGSLLLPPVLEGTDLQLQVDEQSGAVMAVLLVGQEGMLEVRAFAAARNGDLWAEVRHEIAADAARRGGTADEREGTFGTELYCQLPVQLEDGTGAFQPSRIIGWNGPRWMLRAALVGRPAVEPEVAGPWEDVVRRIVVRRGREALPPGEALPLQIPPDATRMD
jgi:hypothetical protein